MVSTALVTSPLRRLKHSARGTSHRVQGLVRVRDLKGDGPAVTAVRDAIRDALMRSVSDDEKPWIERIEAQRQAMLTSVQPLQFEDFGAGADDTLNQSGSITGHAMVETTLGEMTRRSSSKEAWGLLLFRLVRSLQPDTVLELGTCVGVSAAYIGAALELNNHGHLTTIEGGTSLVQRSRHTLDELGLQRSVTVVHGPFVQTLQPTLEESRPIDLAFIDGHHQKEPTLSYTEQIEGHLAEHAVLAYDDIAWSEGMQAAWRQLRNAPGCALSIDLGGMGLIVRGAPGSETSHAVIPYA